MEKMEQVEKLAQGLKEVLADNLVSVALFGSFAIDDQTKHFSDVNVIVLVKELELSTLKAVIPLVKGWKKNGHTAPLFVSQSQLTESTDVFPIEFYDLKNAHRMVLGPDVFESLELTKENLRHQLEYELRSKLIQLRQQYLAVEGDSKLVAELLAKALSSFTVLFRGTLTLMGQRASFRRKAVWQMLSENISVDVSVFEKILDIREGRFEARAHEADDLFEAFLQNVHPVIRFVNDFKEVTDF